MIGFEVCVRCMTYNQASYIEDALNGFCMQQTSFPFVCCILDDASTDGEQDVIRKYVEQNFELEDKSIVSSEETNDYVLTFARHKNNQNCYFAVFYLKYNHYKIWDRKYQYISPWENVTKYIAMCEGDDYWIDSQKLQRQYDYLETHPSFSLCFHPDYRLLNNGEMIKHCPRIKKDIYNTKDVILLDGGLMATGSMLFRSVDFVYGEERPKFWTDSPVGDEPLRLYLSTKGHIGYINEIMSVYRMASVGSWTSKNLSINFWTKHVVGVLRMYSEFDKYTKHHFRFSIFVAKCILGIKYVKGIWQAFIKKLF
jgi:glycosyltransferase involved in cell wall biosynthesis